LIGASDLVLSYCGKEVEWEMKFMWARAEEGISELKEAKDWNDLREKLKANWIKIRGCCFFQFDELVKFEQQHGEWAMLQENKNDPFEGMKTMVISETQPDDVSLDQAKLQLINLITTSFHTSQSFDKKAKTEGAYMAREDWWLAVLSLLQADNVYTGNLFDLKECEKTLFSLDRSERLPNENTLETLMLLRRCWVLIDVFNWYAWYYKWLSKLSYFLMLSLGTVMITFTAVLTMYPDWIPMKEKREALLALSLFMGLVQGIVTIVEPARKWMHLKGGALGLKSKIWMFRTRVGDFQGSAGAVSAFGRSGADRVAEQRLLTALTLIQEKVAQSSGLKKTNFYAVPTSIDDVTMETDDGEEYSHTDERTLFGPRGMSRNFRRHGQFKYGEFKFKPPPCTDNHHSPATPEEYIKWRIMPALQFYQKRIPQYSRRRLVFQGALVLSSVMNALVSALGQPSWTAIIASLAGGIAAWQEFVSVEKKLERHSTVSSALERTLVWWQALTEVDQAAKMNIEHLVQRTEEILTSELAAWLSDAEQAAKQMKAQEASQKTSDGTNGGGTAQSSI